MRRNITHGFLSTNRSCFSIYIATAVSTGHHSILSVMASYKMILLLAVVVAAVAGYPTEHEEHYDHHPHYEFEYSVHDPKTHDLKSQKESRYGDQVKGYYMLKDADGSIREVHYSADKHSGFKAEVTKDGHPIYEEQSHHQEVHHPQSYHHEVHHPETYHHATSSQKFYSH